MSPEDILKQLTKERDRLAERAQRKLVEAEAELRDLRENLGKGMAGEPYYRRGGDNALFSAQPIDLSVVNAAYDAIERVAHFKLDEDEEVE